MLQSKACVLVLVCVHQTNHTWLPLEPRGEARRRYPQSLYYHCCFWNLKRIDYFQKTNNKPTTKFLLISEEKGKNSRWCRWLRMAWWRRCSFMEDDEVRWILPEDEGLGGWGGKSTWKMGGSSCVVEVLINAKQIGNTQANVYFHPFTGCCTIAF